MEYRTISLLVVSNGFVQYKDYRYQQEWYGTAKAPEVVQTAKILGRIKLI